MKGMLLLGAALGLAVLAQAAWSWAGDDSGRQGPHNPQRNDRLVKPRTPPPTHATVKFGIHHPRLGMALKEKMDALGVECQVRTGIRPGSEEWTALAMDFVKKHFGMKDVGH
jgi:hypothetical protein